MESSIISFAENPEPWRTKVQNIWAFDSRYAKQLDPEIPGDFPNYLLDRYAYRLFRLFSGNIELPIQIYFPYFDVEAKLNSWNLSIEKALTGVPSLNIAPPSLEAKIPEFRLLGKLLTKWCQHLQEFGIDIPLGYYENPSGKTWYAFLKRSAHFPDKLPAIRGPSFYERLSSKQKKFVLEKHGHDGLIELYVFLLQVHEETHLLQKGEPMLSEIVLAWLWCNFLNKEDLWYWQRNDEKDISFNQEQPWVARIFLENKEVRTLFQDTYLGTKMIFSNSKIYDHLCLIAWLFDSKAIRYKEYLELITNYFEHRDHEVWLTHMHKYINKLYQKLSKLSGLD